MNSKPRPEVDARLSDWLAQQNARCLWQSEVKTARPGTISAYLIRGRVILVQIFENHGFEIYAPVSKSLMIDDTFAAAEKQIKALQ